MTCSIVAPAGSYNFKHAETVDGIVIENPSDIKILPSSRLADLAAEYDIDYELVFDIAEFERFFNFSIYLKFKNDADAVRFKLVWEE